MKKPQLPKPRLSRKKKTPETPSRITNETVAEHREKILAGGRKFKYPHQYVKHRLVINAVIIATVFVVIITSIGWWQLYKAQNTSEFMYRVTRVVPVAVGSVDGESIRYSDYLMRYRSQELWLKNKGRMTFTGEDGQRQLDFIKRSVLDGLVADVYAQKVARAKGIAVTEQDIQAVIDKNRHTATGQISQEVYDASTKDTLGYSPDEYRHIIKQSLTRHQVAYAIDTKAAETKATIEQEIAANPRLSFDKLVDKLEKQDLGIEVGASGLVQKNNQDGGLSQAALGMKDGEVSAAIKSTTGDGYYFVHRLSANDRQISYQYIKVPLTVFDNEIKQLRQEGKVKEHISIPQATPVEQKEK